jgi:predicted LPLAT superfamily acyltransferase
MAYIVTFGYVLFYPGVRRRARFYLEHRFPERHGLIRRFLDTYRLLRNFARTLVDMAALGILGRRSLIATSPDRARLLSLGEGNRGFVLLNAHVGSWQLGLVALEEFRRSVSLVMVPDPKLQTLLGTTAVKTIDPRTGLQGVLEMTQALLQGEIVGLMGDRTFGDEQNTVNVQFLGGQVALPVSSYRLASAAGVPVAVLMTAKTGYRSYDVRLMRVIEVTPGLGRDARNYAVYARQFAEVLEEFVAQYPWQFYNFYDLWAPAAERGVT